MGRVRLSRLARRLPRNVALTALFAVALGLYELALFVGDEDRHFAVEMLRSGDWAGFARAAVLSLIAAALTLALLWVAAGARWLGKLLALGLFAAALITEYAHHQAFARFSHYSTAAVGMHVGDPSFAANAVLLYFHAASLLPIMGFATLLVLARPDAGSVRRTVVVTFAAVAVFAATAYFSTNRYPVVSPAAFARTAIGYPVIANFGKFGSEAFGSERAERERVPASPGPSPSNNIVLIVDESVRADFVGVNGNRATGSAVLAALAGTPQFVNFGTAVAATTCSETANNLIMTGLIDLPDSTRRIERMPTLFQFAKAMGYRTFDFDGQVSSVWKGTVDDLRFIDRRVTPVQLSAEVAHDYDIDAAIARRVRAIVAGSTGNFIWVNKRGIHEPYGEAAPPRADAGKRRNLTSDPRSDTRRLVADYDNAIRYNHRIFFDTLLGSGLPRATSFLYTSDHGQSLRQGGATVSHCSTTPMEAAVPLIVIGEAARSGKLDPGYAASHANIFPTILDLMQVPAEARGHRYARSLVGATRSQSQPRFYYDHDITGEDGGQRHRFDD